MLILYIWIISFLSLYISLFWIVIMSIEQKKNTTPLTTYPSITIAVPAYNEGKTITTTLTSLTHLTYPKEKLHIYVIDDGSKDNTRTVVQNFIRTHPKENIHLLTQQNKGKAAALNHALRKAKGDYFVVCDADNTANPATLENALRHFDDKKTGAVISAIKVQQMNTTAEKIQRIEYIFSSFVRNLMSVLGTLHTTHGVLSVFRTDVLKKVKGFDEKNLTEDFEIAMRLRYHGYAIKMCNQGWNYTKVPPTFRALWVQRVRWFRGFIANNLRYKKMLFRKKYGLLGRFQIPIELLTLFLVFFSLGFFTYQSLTFLRRIFYRLQLLELGTITFDIPSLKMLLLSINWGLFFPATITLCAGIYLYIRAHHFLQEKWHFHFTTLIYLFLYPLLRSLQWLHALFLEISGAQKRWR